jgi:hypothetical protein
VFSGARIHGIVVEGSTDTVRADSHAGPHSGCTLALHGGTRLCIATLRSECSACKHTGEQGVLSHTLSEGRLRLQLCVHCLLQPSRHWILTSAFVPGAQSERPACTATEVKSEQSAEDQGSLQRGAGVVLGLIDNSMELWHFTSADCRSEARGIVQPASCQPPGGSFESAQHQRGGAQWRPRKHWRVESAERMLLYCMDIAVAQEAPAALLEEQGTTDACGAQEGEATARMRTDVASGASASTGFKLRGPISLTSQRHLSSAFTSKCV